MQWLESLNAFGPVVGALVALIYWQARSQTALIEQHDRARAREVERLDKHATMLLEHVLKEQRQSSPTPTRRRLPPGDGGAGPQFPGSH